MRLVDHVYDDQVIDQLTVKLILPEGARYHVCSSDQEVQACVPFSFCNCVLPAEAFGNHKETITIRKVLEKHCLGCTITLLFSTLTA